MAFMMPVVKNDWDIYNTHKARHTESEHGGNGRMRKVSESRSEGPSTSPRSMASLSPHRSAPAMHQRSYSYNRPPPSRSSYRHQAMENCKEMASSTTSSRAAAPVPEKFHSRLVDKLRRALKRSETRSEERSS